MSPIRTKASARRLTRLMRRTMKAVDFDIWRHMHRALVKHLGLRCPKSCPCKRKA